MTQIQLVVNIDLAPSIRGLIAKVVRDELLGYYGAYDFVPDYISYGIADKVIEKLVDTFQPIPRDK